MSDIHLLHLLYNEHVSVVLLIVVKGYENIPSNKKDPPIKNMTIITKNKLHNVNNLLPFLSTKYIPTGVKIKLLNETKQDNQIASDDLVNPLILIIIGL